MTDEHKFTWRTLQCPNGHKIKLETLIGTPNMIQKIQCPTCQIEMVVFAGDIRGIVPIEE
jgi:hypothetical protein